MYDHFSDHLKSASLDIYAMEVYHNNETVYHYDVGINNQYPVYSVTKSITSAAFSLACNDGLMTAETKISELFPKKYKQLMSQKLAALPMSRFLTMTAGEFPFRPYGNDWLETIFSLDIDPTDTSFHYSNIPAYIIGAAIENALSEPLIKYLDRRLFGPLGIHEPPCSTSPEGYFYGATGMSFSVSELALLGRLCLQKGTWRGISIIPEMLIDEAVTAHVHTNKGDKYGYFFRIADDHFSMVGKWGQRCMIYPKNDLVIAYLSHQPEQSKELYREMKSFANSILAGSISQLQT